MLCATTCQRVPHAISKALCSLPPHANGFLKPLAGPCVLCHYMPTYSSCHQQDFVFFATTSQHIPHAISRTLCSLPLHANTFSCHQQDLVLFATTCQWIPHAISRTLCSLPLHANGLLMPLAGPCVLCHYMPMDSSCHQQDFVFFATTCQGVHHAISRTLCSLPPLSNRFLMPLAVNSVPCRHIQTHSSCHQL